MLVVLVVSVESMELMGRDAVEWIILGCMVEESVLVLSGLMILMGRAGGHI